MQKSLVWTHKFPTFLSESDRRLQWWTGREFQPTFQDTSLLLFSNLNLLSWIWGYLELEQVASEISNLSSCLLSNWVKPSFLCSYITQRTYRMAVVFSFPHTGAPEQEYRQRHKKKDRCRVYSYPTPLYVPVQLYSYPTPLYVSTPLYVQLNSYPTLHPSAALSISKLKCILIQPLTSLYKCTMFPL